MTASTACGPFSTSASRHRRAERGPSARRSSRPSGLGLALAVLAGLVLAMLLAPEQPRAQADICQRHHGEQACRVW